MNACCANKRCRLFKSCHELLSVNTKLVKGKYRMAQRRNNARPARNIDPDLKNNPAFKSKIEALMAAIVPENWTKLDISFPPYFKAELATGFRAKVLSYEAPRNERDFGRFVWQNTGPAIDCRRGAVADGEIETVETGRIFTTGAFAGLPLEKYFGFELAVIVADMRQLPGNEDSDWVPRDFWVFETHVSPETLAMIESQREEDIQFKIAAARNAKRLAVAEMERINAHKELGSNIGIPVPGYGQPVAARV